MKNRQKNLVAQLSDKELLWNFYVSQLFIFCIGILLSRLIFQNWFYPFSLFNWADTKIITVGLSAALFVIILDVCFMKLLPKTVYDDGGINERLFSNRRRWHIVVMTLIVAFGEEILFRGVLQTAFGLVVASLLFAFVHFRYLFHPFLFANVVILSFVIGVIFQTTENLAVCVLMHFIIDCSLGFIIHSKRN
ncbi:CPBP family intramembrane glutamic endopeptidase [Fervidibacillus albus]|uniref:CPBP family intramembrane metalloprotease n=1 Tax=Fervidibacillus albus TaxID=2980026 RepID=A0A9E8RWC8_9BACI|nr:CPBP family intramembrane glutamic endopeptidase [Fervidibacillus albus]WAA10531.1 CPBP family intramembrane metalloprotease [Fervidibacillus albus]